MYQLLSIKPRAGRSLLRALSLPCPSCAEHLRICARARAGRQAGSCRRDCKWLVLCAPSAQTAPRSQGLSACLANGPLPCVWESLERRTVWYLAGSPMAHAHGRVKPRAEAPGPSQASDLDAHSQFPGLQTLQMGAGEEEKKQSRWLT